MKNDGRAPMQHLLNTLGRFSFFMTFIKYSDSTSILSDILPIAGAGTVMNRREELLDVGLISDKKIKKGRRYYIVYELTPKGERVLEQLETTLEILEE